MRRWTFFRTQNAQNTQKFTAPFIFYLNHELHESHEYKSQRANRPQSAFVKFVRFVVLIFLCLCQSSLFAPGEKISVFICVISVRFLSTPKSVLSVLSVVLFFYAFALPHVFACENNIRVNSRDSWFIFCPLLVVPTFPLAETIFVKFV